MGSPAPSDGATPTVPVVPSASATASKSASSATPRPQPTENEDSEPRETRDPVGINAEAEAVEGIEVRLSRIEPVEGEVTIAGEAGARRCVSL